MTVKKDNGAIVFQSDYELSRDFSNDGIILFTTYPGLGGGYHTKEKYIETNGRMRHAGGLSKSPTASSIFTS